MLATGASPWNSALISTRALEEGDSCGRITIEFSHTAGTYCVYDAQHESPSSRALCYVVLYTTGSRPWLT